MPSHRLTLALAFPRCAFVPASLLAATLALVLQAGCSDATEVAEEQPAPTTPTPPKSAPGTAPPKPVPPPAASTAGGPQISFPTKRKSLGRIWDVNTHDWEFPFTNTGSETLRILKLDSGCSCTTATVPTYQLAPGASSAVKVNYNPKGHSGRKDLKVKLVTNATPGGPVELSFDAIVTPFLAFEPSLLRFDVVALGQEHRSAVAIDSPDPDFVIESLKPISRTVRSSGLVPSGNHLAARILGPDEPVPGPVALVRRPGRQIVEVTIKDDAPWGVLYGQVDVTCRGKLPTGETVTHTATINANASIYGELQASDQAFRVSTVSPGAPFTVTNRLTRPSGRPFSIRDARITASTAQGVKVRAEPIRTISEVGYELVLTGTAGTRRGPINGVVEITTDVAGEEQIYLRFTGYVRP